MSQAHPRPTHGGPQRRRTSGALLAGAGLLVIVALVFVPWAVGRFTQWTAAPPLATFVALSLALFFWFYRAQQLRQRTAAGLALTYSGVVAGALWLWQAL